MIEFRFTLEAAGPDCSDADFAEWVACETDATGHVSRDGRHYIHFTRRAVSLDAAVKDAVDALSEWNGLDVLAFRAACSNSGMLARA